MRTLVSIASGLLLLAMLAFWTASYRRPMRQHWAGSQQTWFLTSHRGRVVLALSSFASTASDRSGYTYDATDAGTLRWFRNGEPWGEIVAGGQRGSARSGPVLGFESQDSGEDTYPMLDEHGRYTVTLRYRSWAVPYWALAVVTAIPLACPCGRALRRRRRRGRPGFCPDCGYDLRATSERCPECGRPTRNAAAA